MRVRSLGQSPAELRRPAHVQFAIAGLRSGGEVVIAVDNDQGGDQLTLNLTQVFETANRNDLTFSIDSSIARGSDSNATLSIAFKPNSDATTGDRGLLLDH